MTIEEASPPTLRSSQIPHALARIQLKQETDTTPLVVDAFGPGKKFDAGKVRTDLLPMGALARIQEAARELSCCNPASSLTAALSLWRNASSEGEKKYRLEHVAACVLAWLEDEHGIIVPGKSDGSDPLISVWELFPNAIGDVAKVLTFGANKYGPNNWQNVKSFHSRYSAALLRHVLARCTGEITDPESGLFHLAHAATNALFLLSEAVGHDKPLDLLV